MTISIAASKDLYHRIRSITIALIFRNDHAFLLG